LSLLAGKVSSFFCNLFFCLFVTISPITCVLLTNNSRKDRIMKMFVITCIASIKETKTNYIKELSVNKFLNFTFIKQWTKTLFSEVITFIFHLASCLRFELHAKFGFHIVNTDCSQTSQRCRKLTSALSSKFGVLALHCRLLHFWKSLEKKQCHI